MKLWGGGRGGKCSIGATSAGTRWTLSSRPTERDQRPSSANGPRTISIPQILLHSGTNIRKATTSSSLTMWSVPLPAAMETYERALMAFGPSPIRFLHRPSEAPLLSAGPEKAAECWSELGASFPLIFRPSGGVGDDIAAPPS